MTHKALLRQLQISCLGLDPVDPLRLLVDDVIAALAQQEQEPVAYWKEHAQGLQRDYDSLLADFQAQRKPLTDEQIEDAWRKVETGDFYDCVQPFARAVEAAHGIKENT
jgi:hypothetical protein